MLNSLLPQINKRLCHLIPRLHHSNFQQCKLLSNISTFSLIKDLSKARFDELERLYPESTTLVADQPKRYDTRRSWSNDDTQKLLKLVKKYGNKWKVFESYFPGRSSFCIRSHYLSVVHDATHWTLEEKKILKEKLGKLQDPDKINWEAIQTCLPKKRSIKRIQQFYQDSIRPSLNQGGWTDEESKILRELLSIYGKDWCKISNELKTRSEKQCKNKWIYEITVLKKGEFTKEEDEALIEAVNKYGKDAFQKIKREIKSLRSVPQLKARYTNCLDPDVDRSPWTKEEKELLFKHFSELKNVRAVKAKMKSKRSIRDMYNKLRSNKNSEKTKLM
ncbi:MAG: hypothetical protein EXX96DRAFT_478166 [Benjaminiella poitrasii]|nr:MAG: hypothetical protein EXX96DRAFT_478166 [Benjaminiella poitrasii]